MLSELPVACEICGAEPESKRAHAVDHDHQTGLIRGTLCRPCNQGLGHFRDDPNILRKAAEYLEQPPRWTVKVTDKRTVTAGIP